MTTENENDYDLIIMLAEMPAPVTMEGLVTVHHAQPKHPQLGSYPANPAIDYPDVGYC